MLLAESDSRSGYANGGLIGFTILGVLLGRAANIIPLAALANCWRRGGRCAGRRAPPRISWQWQLQMWHAGLRGAIAYSISLTFPGPLQPILLSCTSVLVLVMVAVMGSTTAPLLGALGIPFGKRATAAAAAENAADFVNGEPAGGSSWAPCSRYTRYCSDVCGFVERVVNAVCSAIDHGIVGSSDHGSCVMRQLGAYCVCNIVAPASDAISRAAHRFGTRVSRLRLVGSVMPPPRVNPRIENNELLSERAAIQVNSSTTTALHAMAGQGGTGSVGGIVEAGMCVQDSTDAASGATLASILSGVASRMDASGMDASRVDAPEMPNAITVPGLSDQGMPANSLTQAELQIL